MIGAGDAIVAPDSVASHLRMGCAVALPLGGQAAETLLASLRGTALPVLSIGFVIQCISLGRKKGYIQVVRNDDTPRALHVRWAVAARFTGRKHLFLSRTLSSDFRWRKSWQKPA